MKPLNLDSSPCSPTSSNCVIWQGPDIACINLCKGDTISSVVYKLATELCTVMDTLKISSYNLSCFNLTNVTPQTFQDLIDLIILKVCELETASGNTIVIPGAGGSPTDTIVIVASCFIVGTQTTMNLQDYLTTIGTKICDLITDISVNTNAIEALCIRVTYLENATPPSYTTPQITLDEALASLSPATLYNIDTVLNVYINDVWFSYVGVTGSITDLSDSIIYGTTSVANSDNSITNPGAVMSVQYAADWITGPTKVADTLKNIWTAIKDIRGGVPTLTVDNSGNVQFTLTGFPAYSLKADVALPTVTMTDGATIAFTETTGAPDYEFTAEVIPFNGLFVRSTGVAITSVAKVTPSLTTLLNSGSSATLILGTTDYNDGGTGYNPTTGEWTCPANGRYNLSFNVSLSHTTDAAGWHTGGSAGIITAGLVSTSNVIYAANSFTPSASISPVANIAGNIEGVTLTAGIVIKLKVLNLTGFDYISEANDVATMSIQRIK